MTYSLLGNDDSRGYFRVESNVNGGPDEEVERSVWCPKFRPLPATGAAPGRLFVVKRPSVWTGRSSRRGVRFAS